jgi:hypothetical protein
MYLSAASIELSESLAGECMTELMEYFYQDKTKVQKYQIIRGQNISTLVDQFGNIANNNIKSG